MEPAEEAKGLEPGHYSRPCGAENVLCVLVVHRHAILGSETQAAQYYRKTEMMVVGQGQPPPAQSDQGIGGPRPGAPRAGGAAAPTAPLARSRGRGLLGDDEDGRSEVKSTEPPDEQLVVRYSGCRAGRRTRSTPIGSTTDVEDFKPRPLEHVTHSAGVRAVVERRKAEGPPAAGNEYVYHP